MKNSKSTGGYINRYPKEVRAMLKKMRTAIKSAVPAKAEEAIKYGIPTFRLNGKNLVHFGGFKDHVSFFPTSSPIVVFKKELSKYLVSKGSIHFPLGKPISLNLVKKIVRYRVKQILTKTK